MRKLIDLQKKLIPELMEVLRLRYRILRFIRLMQPIGRRTLATNLPLTERVLRSEVTFLKEQGLIEVNVAGMSLTEEGTELINQLEEMMKELLDLHTLEKNLQQMLNIKDVIIVPGNSDEHSWVKEELGRATVTFIKTKLLQEGNIIAVTGGTTIASVANMMDTNEALGNTLFLPARGGLGEHVENQANTICSTMAQKAGGEYKLFHVPDELSKDAYRSMIQEPSIKKILDLICSANMVIHGIGDAEMMAKRRGSSEELLKKLQDQGAVAEAFGYYFNRSGDIIHKVQTIGLKLEDLENIHHTIAVAGGASKADAIYAFMKYGPSEVLITDEGAATAILKSYSKSKN